jgi:hypothetical protein
MAINKVLLECSHSYHLHLVYAFMLQCWSWVVEIDFIALRTQKCLLSSPLQKIFLPIPVSEHKSYCPRAGFIYVHLTSQIFEFMEFIPFCLEWGFMLSCHSLNVCGMKEKGNEWYGSGNVNSPFWESSFGLGVVAQWWTACLACGFHS